MLYEESNDADHIFISSSPIPQSQWSHVVATRDAAGNVALYVNGVLDSQFSDSAPPHVGDSPLFIGTSLTGIDAFASFFRGSIDEVRIYNRPLCAGEVEELYRQDL